MKRVLFFCWVLLSAVVAHTPLFAQNQIETLKTQLSKTTDNNQKLNILSSLAAELTNTTPQEAVKYSNQTISLARKVGDKNFEATGYLHLGNAYFAMNRFSQSNESFNNALDLYEGVYYKSGDGQALWGICESYASLSKWYRSQKEEQTAAEYQSMYQSYQKRFETLYKDFIPRTYANSNTGSNPKTDNSDNKPKVTTPPKLPELPNVDESLLLELAKEDSLLLQAKDLQIRKLRQDRNQKESQISNLTQDNLTKEEELEKQKSSKTIWIALLSALLVGALGFAFYHRQQQYGSTLSQRDKLTQYGERINRQEIYLREQTDLLKKKETELVALSAQLDDAKIETNLLTQILKSEIQPQLSALVNNSIDGDKTPINQTGLRLLNLINTTVDVQNFEKVKPQFELNQNAVLPIAQKVIESFDTLIKEKKIKVENNINPAHLAYFDSNWIERVFLNLLDNSLKFTAEKGKLILDSQIVEELNQQFVKVSLQDTGKSIPASSLPLVFEKNSPDDARPSGLGLHFVKLIIEQHHGKVAVLSKEGYGTSFIFSLPTKKV
jgi:signal transduction histidine kinase